MVSNFMTEEPILIY